MSTYARDIIASFDRLRDLCDPRGHALLNTMEEVFLAESALLDRIFAQTRPYQCVVDESFGLAELLAPQEIAELPEGEYVIRTEIVPRSLDAWKESA